jgi:hypothetical protein
MMEDFAASVFGMPKAAGITHDERKANNRLMDGLGFPSIYKEPELIQQPATDEMHAIGRGIRRDQDDAPPAGDMISMLAVGFDIDTDTALRWLAQRADDFKTLHAESQKK